MKAYVQNLGNPKGEYVLHAEVYGRRINLLPNHLTEVSEQEAKTLQFHYAHMGVHYVSEENARGTRLPIVSSFVLPPDVVEAESVRVVEE